MKYISATTMPSSIQVGIGIGYDTDDCTACLLIMLGWWLIAIGPHT